MPKLPTYSANIQGGGASGGRRATAEDAGAVDLIPAVREVQKTGLAIAGQIATDREREAREAERLRKEQEAKVEREAALRRAQVIADGTNQFLDYQNQAAQKPFNEMPDMVADFNQKFDDFRNKAIEQETDPIARQELEIGLSRMRAGLIDNAMRAQSQRAGVAASSALRDVFSNNTIAVQKSPALLEQLLADEKKLIGDLKLPGLTYAQTQALYEDRRHVLPGAAVGARIAAVNTSRDAKALKAELEGNKRWQELLSGEQYARALNTLTKDIKTFANAERAAYVAQVQERINEAAAGIPNGLSVREAGGDPKLTRAINGALAIGKARQDIKSLPANEVAVIVQKALTQLATSGDYTQDRAYAEAVLAADNERRRALAQDSAGYAIQNVTPVKQAYEAMVNSQFDPKAVSRYAAVSAEAQRDLGGPGFSARLLPKAQVDQVLAEVGSLPPEQVANRMESLQKQYGPLWGEILSQMGGKLPPGYTTLGRLTTGPDAHTRVDLANALKAGKDLRKNIPDADAKDVDNLVDQNMLPYSRILSQAGPGSQRVLAEELAAARALAYQMVARGENPKTAAKNAANSLIFNRYDMGETFLAPKGMLGAAQREANKLMRTTQDGEFPPAPGGDPALSEDYRRKAVADAARRGYWANVTVDNKLAIEWRSADGTPVILGEGEPVRLFFDDLKNMPNAPRRGSLPRGFTQTPGGAAVTAP